MAVDLRPRSSWKNGYGKTVHIGGNVKIKGCEHHFWSIEGFWYRKDGAVLTSDPNTGGVPALRDLRQQSSLPEDLVEENTSDPHWWDGVVT